MKKTLLAAVAALAATVTLAAAPGTNGRIAFVSTAPLQGVPCNAGVIVGMMYKMDRDGGDIRQITFEQDHDYSPTVMNV